MNNLGEQKDYVKDISQETVRKVSVDDKYHDLTEFLFAAESKETAWDSDFSKLNSDFESIYKLFLDSPDTSDKWLKSFQNWVSEEKLKDLTTSYDTIALIAYIKESTDNFLNEQTEIENSNRETQKELTEHQREINRLKETITDNSVTMVYDTWLESRWANKPENQQKKFDFENSVRETFNLPQNAVINQETINTILSQRLEKEISYNQLSISEFSQKKENILKSTKKSVEKDLNRLWKGKEAVGGKGYIYIENVRLTDKEGKSLKQLFYAKDRLFESMDRDTGKNIAKKLEKLNTSCALSAIKRIDDNPEAKAYFQTFAARLNSGRITRDALNALASLDEKTLTYLQQAGYYPKSKWGKLTGSELGSFVGLYADLSNISPEDKKELISQLGSGDVRDVYHTKQILNNVVDMEEVENASTLLANLFSDLNYDTKLINKGDTNNTKKIDQGTKMGYQIGESYRNSVLAYGEETVAKNIAKVLASFHNGRGIDHSKVSSAKDIVNLFKQRPALLQQLRDQMMLDPQTSSLIFTRGVDYTTARIEQIKNQQTLEEKKTEIATNYVNALPEAEKERIYGEFDSKIDEILQNLKEEDINYQIAEVNKKMEKESDPAKKVEYQKIIDDMKVLQASLSTGETFSAEQRKEMINNWMISGLAAGIGYVDMANGMEDIFSVWVWAGVTNNKWNTILDEKLHGWVSNASVVGGISYDINQGKFGVSLGPIVSGGQDLGKWWRWFHSEGATYGTGGLLLSTTQGIEKTLNKTKSASSLDAKSLYSAWGTITFTGDFAGQIYLRRSKVEGIENQTAAIKEKMKPIFNELFQGLEGNKDNFIDVVYKNLQATYGKETSGDTLYEIAVKLNNMLINYSPKDLENGNADVLSSLMTDRFARYWRDESLNDINGNFSLSQIGVGTAFIRWFSGFLGLASIAFDKTKVSFEQTKESKDTALSYLNTPEYYDKLDIPAENWDVVAPKLKRLNTLISSSVFSVFEQEGKKYIALDIATAQKLSKKVSFNIENELAANNTKTVEWTILLPYSTDFSVGNLVENNQTTQYVAIGQISWRGTQKLDFDAVYSGSPDTYRVSVETISQQETCDISIDGKPTDTLVTYLEGDIAWSDALVKFRYSQRTQWNPFAKAIHTLRNELDPDKKWDLITKAKEILPPSLQTYVDSNDVSQAENNLRYIYASLSRVSQTVDKQLSLDAAGIQAKALLEQVRITPEQKSVLTDYINNLFTTNNPWWKLTDEQYKKMKSILKIWSDWNTRTDASNRLHNLLAPAYVIVEGRNEAYKRRVRNEYSGDNTGAEQQLLNARERSIAQIKGDISSTDGSTLSESEYLKGNYIMAVAGYEARNARGTEQIDEKFIGGARIVKGSEVPVLAGWNSSLSKGLVHNYFKEMKEKDATQYEAILKGLSACLKNEKQKEVWLPEDFTIGQFVDALSTKKVKDANGVEHTLNFDMQFAIFADCMNEGLVFGNLKVESSFSKENRYEPEGALYYQEASTTSEAKPTVKTWALGVVVGKENARKIPDHDTEPLLPEAPDHDTEPVLGKSDLPEGSVEGNVYTHPDGTQYDLNYEYINVIQDGKAVEVADVPVIQNSEWRRYLTKGGEMVPLVGDQITVVIETPWSVSPPLITDVDNSPRQDVSLGAAITNIVQTIEGSTSNDWRNTSTE